MKFLIVGPLGAIFFDPNFVLVCDSKTGSSTLMLMAATIDVLISDGSKSFLKKSRIVFT